MAFLKEKPLKVIENGYSLFLGYDYMNVNSRAILPQVRDQFIYGGTCTVQSVLTTSEARYRQYMRQSTFARPEKYEPRINDLLLNLFLSVPKIESYSYPELCACMTDPGLLLYDNTGSQSGSRLRFSDYGIYNLWNDDVLDPTYATCNTVAAEIMTNGPVAAMFFPDENIFPLFSQSNIAQECIYSGLPKNVVTEASVAHSVSLIGVGMAPDPIDGWGDYGVFRLDPRSVKVVLVPIVEVV